MSKTISSLWESDPKRVPDDPCLRYPHLVRWPQPCPRLVPMIRRMKLKG